MKRKVFYVSDRTGITAETLGHSLLTQFDGIDFERESLRFIDSIDKASAAAAAINEVARESGVRPLVFSTLVEPPERNIVADADGVFFDLFDVFIEPLEQELGVLSSHTAGRSHGMENARGYASRIDAVNFALQHDDGTTTRDYDRADVILLGVSRSGKTPTCLYLALQYGVNAANYPLTEDDLAELTLPARVMPFRDKLFGLTIRPERLHQIRSERRPNSRYASLRQCQTEVRQVEAMFRSAGLDYLDSTSMSVEEIAATLMDRLGHRPPALPPVPPPGTPPVSPET